MPTARAVFQLHLDGLTGASLAALPVPVSLAWTFEDAAGDIDLVNLASGLNPLTAPPKATMLIVIPPATNTTAIVLKADSGDPKGVQLNANCGTILALAVTTPIALQVAAAVSGVRLVWV